MVGSAVSKFKIQSKIKKYCKFLKMQIKKKLFSNVLKLAVAVKVAALQFLCTVHFLCTKSQYTTF